MIHTGLHADAKERKETDAGRNAEMSAGCHQCQKSANGGHRNTRENQHCPFQRLKHCVEDEENDEDSQRHDDLQSSFRALLALIFTFPSDVVTARQLSLLVDLVN